MQVASERGGWSYGVRFEFFSRPPFVLTTQVDGKPTTRGKRTVKLIITEEDKTERVIEAVRVGAVVYALRLQQPGPRHTPRGPGRG